MSGRLTIWIDGREALPVRAIPYVTGWRYSPDVVAASLARVTAAPFEKLRNLVAYHRPASKPQQVMPCEWNAVVVQVKGFEAGLHELRPDIEAADDHVGIAAWENGAALKLPAGVFVWLDDFLREREADNKRIPHDRPVILAPMLDADTRAAVLKGFEDCPRHGPDADRAMIGNADVVASRLIDDQQNIGGVPVEVDDMPDSELPECLDEETVDALLAEGNHLADWFYASLGADTWFGLARVKPRDAAMVLCQLDPNDDKCDPATITSDETGPADFKQLLRVFEDVEEVEPKARTLRHWLAIARDKGLKYHSWIDAYALARIEELPTDFGREGDTVEVGAGGTAESAVPNSHPVWWSKARDEGERWYEEKLKAKKEGDPPIQKKHLAEHLYMWLYDKGYRNRSRYQISRSSILEQITGIVPREKVGMGWK